VLKTRIRLAAGVAALLSATLLLSACGSKSE
jgi:hypothetical protein